MSAPGELAALMAAAQQGDEQAYRALLEAVQPVVFRYLRRRLSSDAAAEDVGQDVLLTVHRVRHTYEPSRPFEPWLYSIAKSRMIDHLRKEKRLKSWQISVDVLPEVSGELAVRGMDALKDAVAALPPTQREAFKMLKVEGLSTEEAAERAGVSVSALKVRAHRAYTAVKRAVVPDSED